MAEKIRVYCASPLGFSEIGRDYLYDKIIPVFNNAGLEMVDPWSLTDEDYISDIMNMNSGEEKLKAMKQLNREIAANNLRGIESSHGLFAILDGVDVDSGTSSEIGYAAALGKKITAYRSDFRLTGDNEAAIVNLQVEYCIYKCGGKIVRELKDVESELRRVFIS